MDKYKLTLQEGVGLFDPKTNLHFKYKGDFKTIDDKFINEKDFSGIEFAINCGTIKKEKLTTDRKPSKQNGSGSKEENTENIKEDKPTSKKKNKSTEKKDEDLICTATTNDGSSCSNKATYPEDDPKYCWMHKDKYKDNEDKDE